MRNSRIRNTLLLAVLVGAAGLLAGCGGNSNPLIGNWNAVAVTAKGQIANFVHTGKVAADKRMMTFKAHTVVVHKGNRTDKLHVASYKVDTKNHTVTMNVQNPKNKNETAGMTFHMIKNGAGMYHVHKTSEGSVKTYWKKQ